MLQSAAHMPYPALLAERTLIPLQARSTTFFPTAEQCGRLLASARDEGPCTATAATTGSSGLYSTAADMTLWLKYLLRMDGAGASAQAVAMLPSRLLSQKGLDHAGEPTGIGLGWIHILPTDSPSCGDLRVCRYTPKLLQRRQQAFTGRGRPAADTCGGRVQSRAQSCAGPRSSPPAPQVRAAARRVRSGCQPMICFLEKARSDNGLEPASKHRLRQHGAGRCDK